MLWSGHDSKQLIVITELNIGSSDIRQLLPSFTDRQAARDIAWLEALRRAGFSSSTATPHSPGFDRCGELGASFELPPYFRIGRLRFKTNSTSAFGGQRVEYLENVNYPALMMFRDKSAVLNFSHLPHDKTSRFVQIYLAQAFCSLEPIVVKCTAIDLQNFGGSFALLDDAVPSLELLTTPKAVDAFFDNLPEDMRHRNKAKGYRFPYLYQYNRTHRESALPYHFIVVSSFESDLSNEHKVVLNRLIANNNAAKTGLYFLLLFETESTFQALRKANKELVAITEFAYNGGPSKLEIVDPAGLNTAKDGVHQHLMVAPDVPNENDLDRLVTCCKGHLNRKRPDPVRLPLPRAPQEFWTHSAVEENLYARHTARTRPPVAGSQASTHASETRTESGFQPDEGVIAARGGEDENREFPGADSSTEGFCEAAADQAGEGGSLRPRHVADGERRIPLGAQLESRGLSQAHPSPLMPPCPKSPARCAPWRKCWNTNSITSA